MGLLGSIGILKMLHKTGIIDNEQMTATFISDNEGLIKDMNRLMAYGIIHLDQNPKEADIITAIIRTRHRNRLTNRWKWIRGHQDRTSKWDDLSEEARLNVQADNIASKYLASATPTPEAKLITPAITSLVING